MRICVSTDTHCLQISLHAAVCPQINNYKVLQVRVTDLLQAQQQHAGSWLHGKAVPCWHIPVLPTGQRPPRATGTKQHAPAMWHRVCTRA